MVIRWKQPVKSRTIAGVLQPGWKMGEKKTKAELIKELESLRDRVAQLEAQNGDPQGTVETGQKSRALFESLVSAMEASLPSYRKKHIPDNAKALQAGFDTAPAGVAPAWPDG